MEKRTVNIYSLVWARVGTLILLTPAVLHAASKTYIVTPSRHCCSVGAGLGADMGIFGQGHF